MTFDNYIFDLYGTLIDIHTDEEDQGLWEAMCSYLEKEFSAAYTPKALRKRYTEICREEEELLGKKLGTAYPEIRISWAWQRLICEAQCSKDDADARAMGSLTEEIKYGLREEVTSKLQKLCTFFRESSRDRMVKYDGVDTVLKTLKDSGKKIFLLSNAQHAFTVKELADCGLTDYFDDIFISSDHLMKKPEPLFMKALIKKHSLGYKKCVMIGNDILSDVGVAAKSGIKSVFLNTYSYSDKRNKEDLSTLAITDKELMPVIVPDGSIMEILSL